MSFAKHKNPALSPLSIGISGNTAALIEHCAASVSSNGSATTKLAVNLPHWTNRADGRSELSTMLSALSCSEDMRLFSPPESLASSIASDGRTGSIGPQSKDYHFVPCHLCCSGRRTRESPQPGVLEASCPFSVCANSGSGGTIYNHNSNNSSSGSIAIGGISRASSSNMSANGSGANGCAGSACSASVFEVSEVSSDHERRSSNPEAICSPLLGTSSIWRFESSPAPSTAPIAAASTLRISDWTKSSQSSTSDVVSSAGPMQPLTSAPSPVKSQSKGTVSHGVVDRFANGFNKDVDPCHLLDILEDVARRRRSSLISGNRAPDPMITWKGDLQPKADTAGRTLSRKVFVGGLSRDMDSRCLLEAFQSFGVERIEWYPRAEKGFAYAIFRRESRLRTLLNVCSRDAQNRYYFKVGTLRPYRERQVQLIPWLVDDSDLTQLATESGRPGVNEQTVFVGALHGEMTARDLAIVMQKCFGVVLSVGLDTDKFKYPCGTARVTFQHPYSQVAALVAGYIRVESNKFSKTLQIDPFLQDFLCAVCKRGPGPVFCRHYDCFTYFCPPCFFEMHNIRLDASSKPLIPEGHEPLTKNRVIKKRQGFEH